MKILKNKKFIKQCTIAFAGTLLLTTVVQGASLTKKIDATFRNIQIYYNSQHKTMAQEPFIYNGSVYLPVRAVSELVDKNVQWNDSTNSIFISDKGGDLNAQIIAKDLEIARLLGEKSLLEKKVTELEGNDKGSGTSGNLKNTLSHLEDLFDYEHYIDWEFELSETNSRINVEVSFDSKFNNREWEKLSKSDRERLFRDISREIRKDFKDTPINGKVIDSRTDKTIGSFSYSKTNSFSYSDNSSTSFTSLEKDLKNSLKKIDGTDIPVDDIILKGDEDDITFTVYVDLYTRTLQNTWDDAFEDNPRKIRQDMEYIQEEILRDFKHANVQGFIEDTDSGSTLAKFDGKRLY